MSSSLRHSFVCPLQLSQTVIIHFLCFLFLTKCFSYHKWTSLTKIRNVIKNYDKRNNNNNCFLFTDIQQNTTVDKVIYCSNTSNYSWIDSFVLYSGERPTRNINVFAVCRYVPPETNGVSAVDVCEIEIGGKFKV